MKTKIIILLFFTLLFCNISCSQNDRVIMDKPRVDKNVELLSIVARLAGYDEYCSTRFKVYTDKIENYFKDYSEHEVIKYLQHLRTERGIGYDAVMTMAIHLDEDLNPRIKFSDNTPDLRWGKDNANTFVQLLKDFYNDSNFNEFFEANKEIYLEASKRFLPVYESLDLNWYSTFYGKEPSEKFIIINGLGNGHNNYGVSFSPNNEQKEVYAIMGAWNIDSLGMVIFPPNNYFSTLLHEFNHSFVNHLIDKNEILFKDSGEQIFGIVKDEMTNQAYGNWKIVCYEALVRASVIKYMKDHNFSETEINNEILSQISKGFIWIQSLVEELEKYDSKRDTYPTLESYIPELAKAYKNFATQVEEFDNKKPKITSINELKNGDSNISTRLKRITINFDRPLSGQGYSINGGNKGQTAFPKFDKISYSDDKKSLLLDVSLEKDREYQFILTGKHFKSQEGIGIRNYEVNFKTGE